MFKKILIANRGEIAVRIERTCREMGIQTIALYKALDRSSLHVRLADECVQLESPLGFMDGDAILQIARAKGAEAIHPGYGFLAEDPEFSQACQAAGIVLIAPPVSVLSRLRNKPGILELARAVGCPTVETVQVPTDDGDSAALQQAVQQIGYPLIIKSCRGGRGRGEQLVQSPDLLAEALRRSRVEAQAVFGSQGVYLEKAILPSYEVGVQILADQHGHVIHLGERAEVLRRGNQHVIEEAPASFLTPEQREQLWQMALQIARLFDYQNAGTVEFRVDESGRFYFTEIKARIQVVHPLTEMLTQVDLVKEQIRIAAGEPLSVTQEDITCRGAAMMCRVNAEDPWNHFLPSPGPLRQVRLPGGPEVRVDTYVYSGCTVPGEYDPLLAKLVVWGEDHEDCTRRMRRALRDMVLIGVPTNLPLLQRVLHVPDIEDALYGPDVLTQPFGDESESEMHLRNLAAVAAVFYVRRNQLFRPSVPDRITSGWHRDMRRLSS